MDNYDIVALIVDHLCDIHNPNIPLFRIPRIAEYASVSPLFQRAVESLTFRDVKFRDDEESQARFAAMFHPSKTHRRAAVRQIFVNIKPPCSGQSREEHNRNEKLLMSTISSLFHQLHSWETGVADDDDLNEIAVRIVCRAPDRSSEHRRLKLCEDDISRLPTLRQITQLQTCAMAGGTLYATAMFQLAAHTPKLRELDVGYLDGDHAYPNLRLEQHSALGSAIISSIGKLPHLRLLRLHREGGYTPFNHDFTCLDLEKEGVDPVCEALRLLVEAGNLKKLYLGHFLLSPDLFRDRWAQTKEGGNGTHTSAFWPSLEVLKIECDPVAPDGTWYSTGTRSTVDARWPSGLNTPSSSDDSDDPDADSDEESPVQSRGARTPNHNWPQHDWRRRLDPDTFDPLLRDMIAARMPALRSGELSMDLDQSGYYWAAFTFERAQRPGDNVYNWAVKLANKSPWTPPNDLPLPVEVDTSVPPED